MSTVIDRKLAYKKGIDRDESRKKREDKGIELRKNKREEGLLKRRAVHEIAEQTEDGTPATSRFPTRDEIPALVQGCYVEATAIESVTGLRKLLSLEDAPPIDAVIASGVVPHMVLLLTIDSAPKLQFEAAWCLTNIASGTAAQTTHVVNSNAIPAFVRLLSSPDENTREQAIWALGNIAGDSATLRDDVLSAGALAPLVAQLAAGPKVSIMRNTVWVLSNLCRGKPAPSLALVGPAIPAIAQVIMSATDEETLSDALWALSYLTDGDDSRITAVLESGVALQLVQCMTNSSSRMKVPAVRAIGNIVTGNDLHTQAIVNAGALPVLGQLITTGAKVQERKEACWAISNIAAGTPQQLAAVVSSGVLFPVAHALAHAEFEIKKEACWVLCNAMHGSSKEQALFIAQNFNVLEPMVAMLSVGDAKMVTIALDFIENLLKAGEAVASSTGEGENKVTVWLDSVGGVDKLEELQEHKNEEVYRKAVHILETYLGEDDEEDASIVAPGTCASGDQFAFGIQQQMSQPAGFTFA
ncbi:importin alpha [Pavlovales sp. CCMP2436]|nr:importin alpha [Pavlovales sp. CCMP2436]